MIVPFILKSMKVCEGILIQEDPYQYENLTVDQLVNVYFLFKNQGHHSSALIREMTLRLTQDISRDDKEILIKTLANEERK